MTFFAPGNYMEYINNNNYKQGKTDFFRGKAIINCPQYGTCWDQWSWVCGWLDGMAEKVRELR